MARSRALFFLLLSTVVCAGGARLFAQEIGLPEITWKDPNGKEFHVNDKLVLHFQSNVGGDKLRARVFRGSKQELIATGQPDGKNAEGRYCVIYNSTVHTQSSGLHDEVSFNWYMDMGSLKRRSDGGNDDQVYTVVLENTGDKIPTFRLDPDYVAKYFDRGLEITVKADGYQTTGLWSVVQTVEVGVKKVADETKTVFSEVANFSPGPTSPASAAATGPTKGGTTDCIRVHTLVASDSLRSDPRELEAQLLPEPCVMVGQPTTFHMPTGSMRSGWILR
jgi:hypothetical protein